MDQFLKCGWTKYKHSLFLAPTQINAQVKDVYQRKTGASSPDYIKGLSNPNREKYYDSLVKLQPEVTPQTANGM